MPRTPGDLLLTDSELLSLAQQECFAAAKRALELIGDSRLNGLLVLLSITPAEMGDYSTVAAVSVTEPMTRRNLLLVANHYVFDLLEQSEPEPPKYDA